MSTTIYKKCPYCNNDYIDIYMKGVHDGTIVIARKDTRKRIKLLRSFNPLTVYKFEAKYCETCGLIQLDLKDTN